MSQLLYSQNYTATVSYQNSSIFVDNFNHFKDSAY